jgi:hypothetical protein
LLDSLLVSDQLALVKVRVRSRIGFVENLMFTELELCRIRVFFVKRTEGRTVVPLAKFRTKKMPLANFLNAPQKIQNDRTMTDD